MSRQIIAVAIIAIVLAPTVDAQDAEPYDQSKVPIEVDSNTPNLNKVVLVAGHKSHGPREHEFFAGCAILMNLVKQTPGVFPVMARDGWPKDEKIFEHAKSIVLYMDGGSGHPAVERDHVKLLQRYMDEGVGFANLHYAVEYPDAAAIKGPLYWLGGYYETDWSINPEWEADFQALPNHPITRGVKPFKIRDEWYYNMRFLPQMEGVTPILHAAPPDDTRSTMETKRHPGRVEIEAWAFERANNGRSFGFTGGHYHDNWGDENFRRLVTNAILWTAHVDVPQAGAPVEFDPKDLNKNLDKK